MIKDNADNLSVNERIELIIQETEKHEGRELTDKEQNKIRSVMTNLDEAEKALEKQVAPIKNKAMKPYITMLGLAAKLHADASLSIGAFKSLSKAEQSDLVNWIKYPDTHMVDAGMALPNNGGIRSGFTYFIMDVSRLIIVLRAYMYELSRACQKNPNCTEVPVTQLNNWPDLVSVYTDNWPIISFTVSVYRVMKRKNGKLNFVENSFLKTLQQMISLLQNADIINVSPNSIRREVTTGDKILNRASSFVDDFTAGPWDAIKSRVKQYIQYGVDWWEGESHDKFVDALTKAFSSLYAKYNSEVILTTGGLTDLDDYLEYGKNMLKNVFRNRKVEGKPTYREDLYNDEYVKYQNLAKSILKTSTLNYLRDFTDMRSRVVMEELNKIGALDKLLSNALAQWSFENIPENSESGLIALAKSLNQQTGNLIQAIKLDETGNLKKSDKDRLNDIKGKYHDVREILKTWSKNHKNSDVGRTLEDIDDKLKQHKLLNLADSWRRR